MHLCQRILIVVGLSAALAAPVLAQPSAQASQAVNDSGAASGHVIGSAAHSIAASGQVTSGALAVPFLASGAVLGSAAAGSAAVGSDAMRAASAPIGKPLPITDEAITVMSPTQALKPKSQNP